MYIQLVRNSLMLKHPYPDGTCCNILLILHRICGGNWKLSSAVVMNSSIIEFYQQVYKELYTYDEHANTSITHYWKRDGQTIDTYRASTPAYAHDANTTFYVRETFIELQLYMFAK